MRTEPEAFIRALANANHLQSCAACGYVNSPVALRCRHCGERTPAGLEFLHLSFRSVCARQKPWYYALNLASTVGVFLGLFWLLQHAWPLGAGLLAVFLPAKLWTLRFYRAAAGLEQELVRSGVDPWGGPREGERS